MSRIENGIEIVPRHEVTSVFERIAANAWNSQSMIEQTMHEDLQRPPAYLPERHIEEITQKYTGLNSYLKFAAMAASFLGLHMVVQRVAGNYGTFVVAGLIFGLPLVKDLVPDIIRSTRNYFRK